MAITRTPMVDDDGTGTTGTIINNAWKQEFYNQIDAAAATAVIFSTATGTQHNWAPGIAGAYTLIIWDGAGDLVVTGLAGGVQGQIVTFKQNAVTTTRLVSFAHFSASSADNNKLINIATSAPTPLGTYGVVSYQYDGSYWRLIAHEQGGWITAPFSAANFTGGSGMTWTVQSGDRRDSRYRLSGRTLIYAVDLIFTSVGGTLGSELRIGNGEFGGYTPGGTMTLGPIYPTESGTYGHGYMRGGSINGGTYLSCIKHPYTNWSATTENTNIAGTITFEVS
jgi:hypothetical protein